MKDERKAWVEDVKEGLEIAERGAQADTLRIQRDEARAERDRLRERLAAEYRSRSTS